MKTLPSDDSYAVVLHGRETRRKGRKVKHAHRSRSRQAGLLPSRTHSARDAQSAGATAIWRASAEGRRCASGGLLLLLRRVAARNEQRWRASEAKCSRR